METSIYATFRTLIMWLKKELFKRFTKFAAHFEEQVERLPAAKEMMRVLLVNTSEKTGGAAIAARRLKDALNDNGAKARLLVAEKRTNDPSVGDLGNRTLHRLNFLLERSEVWRNNGFKREGLFDVDTGSYGSDITSHPWFTESDVIHLHWVNQGMLSLKDIWKIARSGKRVVWTMHDMWPFTGICHYARSCSKFKERCYCCPLLRKSGPRDLAARVYERKERLYQRANIFFVACSEWLQNEAKDSSLLGAKGIINIPNAIDSNLYRPRPKPEIRAELKLPEQGWLLLFNAFKVTAHIKGIDLLEDACRILDSHHPELRDKIGIILAGQGAEEVKGKLTYRTYDFGYTEDERKMAALYNAADVLVMPSRKDNLPNTIVEAMTSGVPCVATAVGGIPQMIEHMKNGYLAKPGNPDDIARGIEFLLLHPQKGMVDTLARGFAISHYSEHSVATKYMDLYEKTADMNL